MKYFIAFTLALLISAAAVFVVRFDAQRIKPVTKALPEAVTSALAAPTKATLFSLDPSVDGVGNYKGKDNFHGWKILGQVTLLEEKAQAAAQEFKETGERTLPGGGQALCFNPRHGLQVVQGQHTYDFVLCYECMGMEIYIDGNEVDSRSAMGSPSTLNKLLSDADVPLSK